MYFKYQCILKPTPLESKKGYGMAQRYGVKYWGVRLWDEGFTISWVRLLGV